MAHLPAIPTRSSSRSGILRWWPRIQSGRRRQVGQHGWVLQVRDLAVEVGGRLTLVGGSFSLRAGDKVGLVGRNGAGKTSLLRVLGGEADPAAGVVSRPRAHRVPPAGPAADRRGRRRDRALARALGSRARRRAPAAREAALAHGRGSVGARTSAATRARKIDSGPRAATRPRRRCARSRPGWGCAPTGSTCP